MIVKLLTEHHLEFISLKGGCRGSSESTHVKFLEISCRGSKYKIVLQDVLSVVDVAGEAVQFINKLNGELVADPYRRTNEVIWGICMYHAEVQPEMEGIYNT